MMYKVSSLQEYTHSNHFSRLILLLRMQPSYPDMSVASSEGSDQAVILPLGSGGEVGRSCIIFKFKGRTVMLDCGIHPAKEGLDSLPLFDTIDCSEIDLVLITHFHLDHCGALPYLCGQTNFRGRIYMTSTTKEFFKMVMEDALRVGSSDSGDVVTREWLHNAYDRIKTIEYHQEEVYNGIRFQPFNAGHVLGAAMFSIDIEGVKALYTGDYSREEDRHLPSAEIPPFSPDILIVESTYGRREHEPRDEREMKFTKWIHEVVAREGRCLVPVFALGRAQELLLILEEYWEMHPELHSIPVYYASSLANRCMKIYHKFVGAMNERVQRKHAQNTNPFVFKHIRPLLDLKSFEDSGPCVVLASPGMLQPGVSLELFERWCGDGRNGIIFAGYCVEGTVADEVTKKKSSIPAEIQKPNGGGILKLRMRTVESVSFSAHSDARQTRDFIAELKSTQHVILVHGHEGAMANLRDKLAEDFKARGMKLYTTRNQVPIAIPFVTRKSAKILGYLASQTLQGTSDGSLVGQSVSGVLLASGLQLTVVHPHEIPVFTGLDVSTIRQAMVIPLSIHKSSDDVLSHLQTYFAQSELFSNVNESLGVQASHNSSTTRITVSRDVVVDVEHDEASHTTLTISWPTSRFNDLLADVTCIALTQLLGKTSSSFDDEVGDDMDPYMNAALLPMELSGTDRIFRLKCFHHMMSQFYTSVKTNLNTGVCTLLLEDGQYVTVHDCIDIELGDKSASRDSLEKLKGNLKRVYLTLFPIPMDAGWCECGLSHGDEHRHLR